MTVCCEIARRLRTRWLLGLASLAVSLAAWPAASFAARPLGEGQPQEQTASAAAAPKIDPGADQVAAARESLHGFDSFVNQAIKDWEVPGVAIAIVKNGKVILLARFWHARRGEQSARDLEDALCHWLLHQGVYHVCDGHAGRRRKARLG